MGPEQEKDSSIEKSEPLVVTGGAAKRHHQHHKPSTCANVVQAQSEPVAPATSLDLGQVDRIHQASNGATNEHQGKENQIQDHLERICFACKRSLAKSRHLINIAGQIHKWHPECFKCHLCNHPLDRETSCHLYKDQIVCREDYAKLQRDKSTKCSRCSWPIAASDWVRRAGIYVYHLACFSCDICLRQLSTGEQFTVNIQEKNVVRLLCRLHFVIESQQQKAQKVTESGAHTIEQIDPKELSALPAPFNLATYEHSTSGKPTTPQGLNRDQYLHLMAASSCSATAGSGQAALLLAAAEQQQQRQHESSSGNYEEMNLSSTAGQHHHHLHHQLTLVPESGQQLSVAEGQLDGSTTLSSSGGSSGVTAAGNLMGGLPSKSKRVRTTFTEDQLSILQTHFQIDSNPDGQDLERIATITGLSKRVTQVWFQNSRARQKKYMIKRKPIGSSSSIAAAAAVAAAASSAANSIGSAATIGLPGASSGSANHLHPSSAAFNHNLHTQPNDDPTNSAGHDCYQRQHSQHSRWSNLSEKSELSLDEGEELGDVEDSRSSIDESHLVVSDYEDSSG